MRAQGRNTKIHYKGENEDFIIFVDSVDQVKKWKTDKSIPLTQVVDGFQVFVTYASPIHSKRPTELTTKFNIIEANREPKGFSTQLPTASLRPSLPRLGRRTLYRESWRVGKWKRV